VKETTEDMRGRQSRNVGTGWSNFLSSNLAVAERGKVKKSGWLQKRGGKRLVVRFDATRAMGEGVEKALFCYLWLVPLLLSI
jgi:hypothetical protein